MNDVPILPVSKKQADQGLFLVKKPNPCNHLYAGFEIDESSSKCFCNRCGSEVSAFFVLGELMKEGSRLMHARSRYKDEMARLAARSKTTCNHCGKMTKISRS